MAAQTSWDAVGLVAALNNWVVDSGASTHMTPDDGTLHNSSSSTTPYRVTVGNGSTIPSSRCGSSVLFTPSGHSFHLKQVLHVPSLVRNLLSIRKFTHDNSCSMEFDPFSFSVKDLQTKAVIYRCNSGGDLYTFLAVPPSTSSAFVSSMVSPEVWHRHLGHPRHDATVSIQHSSPTHQIKSSLHLCHACQLGKHVQLSFSTSTTMSSAPFDLVHCDLWTSPVMSMSGYQYYLVIIDDFSHFYWSFPLRAKSDVFAELEAFFAFIRT
uniref:Uncharacterized protein n=1 Tax=Arundo donax TaxID=35708 RepID=A0A0A9H024_ARUDO